MSVRFLIPGPLHPFSDGRPAIALDASPATVAEALAALGRVHPAFASASSPSRARSARTSTSSSPTRTSGTPAVSRRASPRAPRSRSCRPSAASAIESRLTRFRTPRPAMKLKTPTSPAWTAAVLADLDAFLLDHAANERKASASALALVAHYPDRRDLVERLIALAIEELEHYRAVHARIAERGLTLAPDTRSEYLRRLAAEFREGSEAVLPRPAPDRRRRRGARMRALRPRRGGASGGHAPGLLPRARPLRGPAPRALPRPGAAAYFAGAEVEQRLEELLEAESRVVGRAARAVGPLLTAAAPRRLRGRGSAPVDRAVSLAPRGARGRCSRAGSPAPSATSLVVPAYGERESLFDTARLRARRRRRADPRRRRPERARRLPARRPRGQRGGARRGSPRLPNDVGWRSAANPPAPRSTIRTATRARRGPRRPGRFLPEGQGVGLARKIGNDIALALHADGPHRLALDPQHRRRHAPRQRLLRADRASIPKTDRAPRSTSSSTASARTRSSR